MGWSPEARLRQIKKNLENPLPSWEMSKRKIIANKNNEIDEDHKRIS